MDFESLKIGFLSYLEESTKNSSNPVTVSNYSSSSIFMYSEEFKEYLVDKAGADKSIFSMNINEILEMDFVNGQLVENEETANSDTFESSDSTQSQTPSLMTDLFNEFLSDESVINTLDMDSTGDLSIDEVNTFMTTLETDEEGNISFDSLAQIAAGIQDGTYVYSPAESSGNILNRILNNVYSNETIIEALDEDGDGILSDEEKAKFEEYIKGYDGNTDELSEADIKRAYDDIMEGKFSYDLDLETRADEINAEVASELEAGNGATSTGGTSGSRNSFSGSNTNKPKTIENMTLDELKTEKTKRESTVKEAQQSLEDVYSGENEAIKAAQDNYDSALENYNAAVENDEQISEDLKNQKDENLQNINNQQNIINDNELAISQKESEISQQKSVVESLQSNYDALNTALNELNNMVGDDDEEQSEIDSKISEVKAQIETAASQLETEKDNLTKLEDEKAELEEQLAEEQEKLTVYENEQDEIDKQILANCSNETTIALNALNDAQTNIETVKEQELATAKSNLSDAQKELDAVNEKINTKEAANTQREYSVSEFDFDFELNLSSRQENELEQFKKNWEENQDKYEAVEEATGMPAELVAAIHWREGSGNFNTYLHNGEKLGTVTKSVPSGIYFTDWTEAAIDAVTRYGSDITNADWSDIDTYYNYAEHYNGMGYSNRGVSSPYVWAGTDNYTSGKYVSDGVYNANYVDQQLGVAVMLQALLD